MPRARVPLAGFDRSVERRIYCGWARSLLSRSVAVLNVSIALASKNRETLDGVQEYFTRVGARLSNISKLDDAPRSTEGVDVVVLFADDYPREAVLRVVAELTVKLIIVVTGEVSAYAPRAAKAGLPRILVLARPAWGWMLLDAVRTAMPAGGKS